MSHYATYEITIPSVPSSRPATDGPRVRHVPSYPATRAGPVAVVAPHSQRCQQQPSKQIAPSSRAGLRPATTSSTRIDPADPGSRPATAVSADLWRSLGIGPRHQRSSIGTPPSGLDVDRDLASDVFPEDEPPKSAQHTGMRTSASGDVGPALHYEVLNEVPEANPRKMWPMRVDGSLVDDIAAGNLTALTLVGTRVTVRQLEVLSEALVTSTSLRSLNLAGTGLTDEHMDVLKRGLEFNRSLLSVDVSANSVGDRGMAVLARACKIHKVTEHLYLQVRSAMTASTCLDALNECSSRGDPSPCATSSREALALCDKLDLFRPYVSVMLAIVRTWESTPSQMNKMGPRGMYQVCLHATHMPALRSLDVSNNPLGDDGVRCLCKLIDDMESDGRKPVLEHLYLNTCLLGRSGGEALAQAVKKGGFPKLKTLFASDNDLTDESSMDLRKWANANKVNVRLAASTADVVDLSWWVREQEPEVRGRKRSLWQGRNSSMSRPFHGAPNLHLASNGNRLSRCDASFESHLARRLQPLAPEERTLIDGIVNPRVATVGFASSIAHFPAHASALTGRASDAQLIEDPLGAAVPGPHLEAAQQRRSSMPMGTLSRHGKSMPAGAAHLRPQKPTLPSGARGASASGQRQEGNGGNIEGGNGGGPGGPRTARIARILDHALSAPNQDA